MAQQFPELSPRLVEFITRQPMFFVATAAREGRVNVSPKGYDSVRVLGPNRLIWLNLTGSGNETAGHLLDSPRRRERNRTTIDGAPTGIPVDGPP